MWKRGRMKVISQRLHVRDVCPFLKNGWNRISRILLPTYVAFNSRRYREFTEYILFFINLWDEKEIFLKKGIDSIRFIGKVSEKIFASYGFYIVTLIISIRRAFRAQIIAKRLILAALSCVLKNVIATTMNVRNTAGKVQKAILLTDTIPVPAPWDGQYRSLQSRLWTRPLCPLLPSSWPLDTWDCNRNPSTTDPCTKVINIQAIR